MPPKIVNAGGFTVIGIAVRTTNARETTADAQIAKLWGRFMRESVLDKIPDRADANILAVYTDYASDKDGEYTLLLGARVKTTATPPPGMTSKTIPAGQYAVFTSELGPSERVVPATWKRIWSVPHSDPGGDRAYRADYELYDQRATDPHNAQVDIYIGIK